MSDESTPLYPDETQLHGEPIDAPAYGWLRFDGEELRKMLWARGITIEQFAGEYATQMKRRIPGWYRDWEKKHPT